MEEISEKPRLGLFRVKEEKTYTYGNGLLVEYRKRTDERLYYHFDNLGSTIKVTGEDGKVRHTFRYGTYGELLGSGTLSTDMASGIRFLFNGEYGVSTDKNRLNYMRARYYNTDIRRFVNRDVLTGSIDESQSLNRYSYVQGNPVSLVDPFGLCPESTLSAFSGHALLDLLGLVFDGADLVNAIWYLAEGDVKNAVMSAGALLPVIGAIGAGGYKLAKSGIRLGSRVTDAARYTRSFARYADEAGTAVKCAGRKYDDIKTAIKTALRKSDGAKGAGKAVSGSKPNVYIPMDAGGNPIPLRKQTVNGQDIPLPDSNASGPHTVLGGKVSSKTGEVYRQSATFPEGTWPTANGQNVPWSEVHWTDHGTPHHHTNPHQHIFEYNPDKGGWIRNGPTPYYS